MKRPPRLLTGWSDLFVNSALRKEKAVGIILDESGQFTAAIGHSDPQTVITSCRNRMLERQPVLRRPLWMVLYVENEFRMASVDGFNYSDHTGFLRLVDEGVIDEKLQAQKQKIRDLFPETEPEPDESEPEPLDLDAAPAGTLTGEKAGPQQLPLPCPFPFFLRDWPRFPAKLREQEAAAAFLSATGFEGAAGGEAATVAEYLETELDKRTRKRGMPHWAVCYKDGRFDFAIFDGKRYDTYNEIAQLQQEGTVTDKLIKQGKGMVPLDLDAEPQEAGSIQAELVPGSDQVQVTVNLPEGTSSFTVSKKEFLALLAENPDVQAECSVQLMTELMEESA